MTLLAVRHASLGYSRHPVLRDVSFTLSQGTICCLLGANGCGKTTLMRSILGVIPLLKGEILLDSLPVQTLSHRQRAQAIAWVPQAQLKNNGMTMLMSTHHPLHANAIADSIIQVEPDGRVTQGLPTEQLTTKKLAALYRVSADQIHHHLSAIKH